MISNTWTMASLYCDHRWSQYVISDFWTFVYSTSSLSHSSIFNPLPSCSFPSSQMVSNTLLLLFFVLLSIVSNSSLTIPSIPDQIFCHPIHIAFLLYTYSVILLFRTLFDLFSLLFLPLLHILLWILLPDLLHFPGFSLVPIYLSRMSNANMRRNFLQTCNLHSFILDYLSLASTIN